MRKWISVEISVPDNDWAVLVCEAVENPEAYPTGCYLWVARYDDTEKFFFVEKDDPDEPFDPLMVTHWMPLPKAPA